MIPGRPGGGRLKDGKKRTASSRRWLQRQLADPYVAEAKRRGFRSRAAFKLIELDDRFRLLRPGARIVDLGAAPGGWTQVAVERVRAGKPGGGRVLAVDLLEMSPVAGAEVLRADVLDEAAPALIRDALAGPADVVLSDMAPPSTGHPGADHLRIMALLEAAFGVRRRGAGARRRLRLQGPAGRHRGARARRHEAVVPYRPPCQTAFLAGGVGGVLRRRHRLPRAVILP